MAEPAALAGLPPLAGEAAMLGRLGPARDLDGLLDRLARRGVRVPLAQRLRAEHFLLRLSRAGVDLGAPGQLANWLAPILATSNEAEQAIRAELEALAPAPDARRRARAAEPPPSYLWDLLRQDRLAVRAASIVVALLVLAVLVWTILFVRDLLMAPPPPPVPVDGGGPLPVPGPDAGPDPDLAWRFLFLRVLPALFVLVPAACFVYAVLRGRPRREAAITRRVGVGRRFESLMVPPAGNIVFTGGRVRRAALKLKSPDLTGGPKLDTGATIAATVREGGLPVLCWREEARVHEYLLLCERGGGADHMAILADALCRQLDAADVAYTRYDLDVGAGSVRHAAGRRSGPRVETLATVRQRHAGARLILLGGGETLARRFERSGVALEVLVRDFESPLLLDAAPQDRWGWREAWLQAFGVALFAADEKGLEAASAWLSRTSDERERQAGARIDAGEDALLASLEADRFRLASNAPLPPAEQALLVRRLRTLLGGGDGFRLLVAAAVFPRTHPGITEHLCRIVNGRPLDAALACRLSRLPWLRDGRFPDWLRLALLRSLPPAERDRLRASLNLVLDDYRTWSEGRAAAGLDSAGERLEILERPGVSARLLAQLGLGAGLVSGEGIFLRFLDGEAAELDQAIAPRPAPPSWRRIAAAGALLLAAAAAAFFAPAALEATGALIRASGLVDFVPIMAAGIALLGYGWVVLRLWSGRRSGRPPRLGMRIADAVVHAAAFLSAWTLLFTISNTPDANIALPPVLLLLALVPVHFAAEWRGRRSAPLEHRPLPALGPVAGFLYFAVAAAAFSAVQPFTMYDEGAAGTAKVYAGLFLSAGFVFAGSLLFYPLRPGALGDMVPAVAATIERYAISFVLLLVGLLIAALPVFLLGLFVLDAAEPWTAGALIIAAAPMLIIALTMERSLLVSVWLWYVVMFGLGMTVLGGASAVPGEAQTPSGADALRYILAAAGVGGLSWFAIPLGRRVREEFRDLVEMVRMFRPALGFLTARLTAERRAAAEAKD